MDRNLALEMVRATEAAALTAARWMGKGDARGADEAAAIAMRDALNSIAFRGTVVIGRGDQQSVSSLYDGEKVGAGGSDSVDIVLDPLECNKSVAFGRINALAVVALAPRGDFQIPPIQYVEKIAVGPDAVAAINLALPIEENLERIAAAKNFSVSDLTVVMLDRERHQELIDRIRKSGARLHLIPDGDISAAIAASLPGTGIDVLAGTGGAIAGVLTAAALRCVGGELHTRFAPRNDHEQHLLRDSGLGPANRIYRAIDLVRGDNVMFAATGVTDGDMLNGVRYRADGATTHSVVMRLSSRTRRYIVTEHYFSDNPRY